MDIPSSLVSYFTKMYDGYRAAVFDNALEFNNIATKLKTEGKSFRSKIIKGKRAGKKQRSFIIMLVETAEKQNGTGD
jgi:hypothetical protein